MIESNPGISQSALARALGIERSTMVGVLDELEARQLAERCVSHHDRRSYTLALTCDGSALLKTLKSKVRRHEKRIGSGLDSAQRTALIELLRRIYDAP
ncbi:MAG: MarR family winged helix-turn-helix transcriptional regulator, partial [Gammaproteobacteria bacterium]